MEKLGIFGYVVAQVCYMIEPRPSVCLTLAGTGKSYLSARLIAWALDNLPNVGYFFFRESYPETKSAVQALKDVAYQLTENDAFYAKQLLKNVSRKEDIKTVSSAFRRLFVEPFKDDPRDKKTYIFLDGIDQADLTDIQRLLSQLAVREDSLTASCPSNIQIALIGRSYMSETVKFALDPNGRGGIYNTSTVTRDRTAGDVSIFISNAIFRSRILSQTTLEFKQEVIETMEKRVDGLFVLAKFMIAEINRKRHPRSILKSLETYPKEINGMLKTTLASLAEKISEEEAADLNEMLQWVACAEAALTLGQLEAALILEFGDPPVRLEEALRGQYASFFELEREDGITTDELMKQNEKPRAKGRDSSVGPSGGISRHRPSYGEQDRPGFRISPQSSPGHRLSNDSEDRPNLRLSRNSSPGLGAKASPDLAQLSSMRQLSPAPATSSAHSSPRLDSIRQASPAGVQTPDLLEAIEEMEFGSSKTSTLVTFFHASVGEFFRNKENEAMVEGSNEVTVGFDIDKGRIHVLDVCLRIFTDPEWFAQMDLGDLRLAMKQYAACHWQEHLSRINPEQASAEDKTNIATQIYKMLTDDGTIFEWTSLFQNQSVSHEIFTDSSIESLLRWFGDSEVQARLDSDAKKWATESPASPSAMVKQIGRLFARAWLSETFDEYLPTLFCFRIVQNVVIMDTGKTWSDGNARWLEASVDEKISTATQWAGLPKTAHWYRRVGSTYLTLGVYSEALSYYQEALGLDTNSVATAGRIAYCLFKHKRYEDGLKRALECAAEEAEMVSRGSLSGFALSSCKWRLYKDNYLAAECYYHVGKIDEALRYFRKAIDSATGAELTPAEYFEPELGYLEVTASENRHEDLMDLLHDLSTQAENAKQGQNRLVGLLLDQCKMPLVLDLIPRAACKSDQAGFLLDSLEMAIDAAFRMRDMVMVLYLRLSMGITWVYFRDTIDAIAVFEQVSLNEYRPRGNLATRQGHALSFQTLASLYKEQVLHVGWDTTEAAEWITKLETIHKLQETHQNADMPVNMLGSDVDLASVFLALFYRLLGRQEEAHELLRRLILESLEILSDDEPQNDEFAVVTLVRAFLAADDINNALSLAQSMCKINPLVSLTTPADSPVKPRAQPKLPDITSSGRSCAQCLNRISLSKSFVTCKFCMEPFCMECVETVIKKPGNETKDHRDEIVCRSDHAWFTVPPMNRILHTGEILLTDGRVQGFLEWKMRLQQQWKPGAKDVPLAVLSDGPDQVTKSDAS